MKFNPAYTPEVFNQKAIGYFPGYVGFTVIDMGQGFLKAQIAVKPHHLASNGFLHAGSVVTLADTAAGFACIAHLPETAQNFTTLELKANFLSTVQDGIVICEAKAAHLGRSTQLWEARVTAQATGKLMATFSCTQLLLAKKPAP
ncbi:MAG: PaaI family thioesterase [Hyphomicrobiaceae bacterium]